MTTRLINDDPNCQSPDDCRRTKRSAGLCRACAEASGTYRAVANRPDVRTKKDWLTPEQMAEVAAAIAAGKRGVDVAKDYLITRSRVYQIARAAGVYRRPSSQGA